MMPIHQNKEWLTEQYEKTRSIYKMAEIAKCHPRTIHKWMTKHGILMSGMRGIAHTEETKEKISKGVLATNPTGMTGRTHSEKTKHDMSLNRRGNKNRNWKGGVTSKIRQFRRTKEYVGWRAEVISRAGGICEDCGSNEKIEAHHIISIHKDITKALDKNNGMALCNACHKIRDRRQTNV
jgi:hypothetical protein